MKKYLVFLAAAALGALPLSAGALGAHGGGGHPAMTMGHPGSGTHAFNRPGLGHEFRGSGRGEGFAFRHHGPFRGHDFGREDRFFRRHHRFFRSDFAFVGFGFPYAYYPYYPYYPYDGYLYDYSYDRYGLAEAAASPNDLTVAVQSELARLGYYRGSIDGELGPGSRQAIRAFRAAKGLPVTGRVDPKFLRTLERS
jgi:hypothetical protein